MRVWLVAAVLGLCGLSASMADSLEDQRLSTEEIRQVFADVRDEAEVQDTDGSRAMNYWYADGTFSVEWANKSASGTVKGRWYARDDQRCVVMASGLPEDELNRERCSPVYRRGEVYISVNADGSTHGIHVLTPIDSGSR